MGGGSGGCMGLDRWVGGLYRWGVWPGGWGSGQVGGGRLHSKVWTDAHMNATGF